MAQIKVNVAYGATGTLATANIADDAITAAKIADNAVVTAAINADAVTDAKIADDVIGTEHLTAGEVDATALGADSVTAAKIGDNVLNSEHYAAASIDNEHLADNAADTAEIADNAITLAKMDGGTDGNIISYDASGDPVAISTGSDGQVLTSTGAGSPPAFEAAAGGGGKILQVTTRETTTATSTTSTSLVATDVYAVITPSATSSDVIVMMNFRMHVGEGSGTGTTCAMGVKRDIGGAGYNDVYLPLDSEFGHWIAGSNYERSHHARFGLTFLDAPNTTSACTYKLYIRHMGAAGTGDTIYNGGSSTEMSTILMEVDGS